MKSPIRRLRDVHAERSTHTSQEQRNDAPSRTDHKVDAVHEVIRDQLAPRIATMSANAVKSDRREFYYYQKKRSGRRCSCFSSEASPDSQCPICHGQGIVGGYEKYGTKSEIIDITTPNLLMVNCEPNFDEVTTPTYIRLKDGYDIGYVEATLPLRQNIGEIDTYFLSQPLYNRGVTIWVVPTTGPAVQISTADDFKPFLNGATITIRLEFQKLDERPVISHFLIRYKLQKNLIVIGDVPRSEEHLQSTQFGVMELYDEVQIFFDTKSGAASYQNEDMLFRLNDQRKFKLTSINPNLIATTVTSYDVRARYYIPNVDVGIATFLF
jgi:hypothetical protein